MKRLIFAALVVLFAATVADATTYTFNTSDSQFDAGVDNQGWWSATAIAFDANANYFTGSTSTDALRSFFTFDLSSLNLSGEQIISVRLEVQRYGSSGDASETLQFFDVSTDAATLNNNVGTSAAIFNDLGTGTSYGAFNVPTGGDPTALLSFPLNAAAFTDVAAAAGGFFSIGGSCITCTASQFLFNGASSSGIQRLVVETQSIPEPGSLALLGMGLAALAILRRKAD